MASTRKQLKTAVASESDPMGPEPFRVLRKERETHDTFTLALEPPTAAAPFSYEPGQFNMLYVPGRGEAPISMSGRSGPTREILHTIRAVGGVTQALDGLRRGDIVGVRGPFGTSWPVVEAEGRDLVMMAGGIGLAPIRPAIYHVLENRDKYDRVVLLFGARTPENILFQREIGTWRGRFDVDVEVTVDRADPDWRGRVGVVTTLVPHAHFDPDNTVAFVCGPEVMMTFAVRELARAGVLPQRTYVSLERNMKCAIGLCGHCQLGPVFVCKDGPVFRYDRVAAWLGIREI
jgi:NAD(P)H-flavin reductase